MDESTAAATSTDKNVVSDGGKVANALNQAVAGGRLKRFSQKVEQFVSVVSAQSKLRPILQKY